jgi:hypothetical protein
MTAYHSVQNSGDLCFTEYRPGMANFWGSFPKLFINFEEIVSSAHGKFEEQNKAFETSIIIINYWIIIMHSVIILYI